ncbi:MAG: hypothetical protein LBE75_07160 [Burkholderiales bacterium]|jgi:type IV pilus assembly protein PilV|nr:hypothetical protein [Burkholderiales bacterium]
MKKIFEKRCKKTRYGQRGGMLLEVLVSILLFALGIVALVGLQGRSLAVTDDVQYRAEAMHFANAYLGKIWAAATGGITGAQIQTQFSHAGGSADYADFSNQVTGGGSFPGIPGAQAPTVVIADAAPQFTDRITGALVTLPSVGVRITIRWQDREGVVHNYTQLSAIGLNI